MARKVEIGIALAGLAVGLAAWLFPASGFYVPRGDATDPLNQVRSSHESFIPARTLLVSGTGARVKVMIGPDDAEFMGGEVGRSGAESIIYIRRGQKINLDITGTGATVLVQSGIMPYISVKNTATGGSVREL